uniref:Secreted protein n=1 Tax=Parascaris univalens TaxID=6257 RepID=A0A915BDZ0_PARUN
MPKREICLSIARCFLIAATRRRHSVRLATSSSQATLCIGDSMLVAFSCERCARTALQQAAVRRIGGSLCAGFVALSNR